MNTFLPTIKYTLKKIYLTILRFTPEIKSSLCLFKYLSINHPGSARKFIRLFEGTIRSILSYLNEILYNRRDNSNNIRIGTKVKDLTAGDYYSINKFQRKPTNNPYNNLQKRIDLLPLKSSLEQQKGNSQLRKRIDLLNFEEAIQDNENKNESSYVISANDDDKNKKRIKLYKQMENMKSLEKLIKVNSNTDLFSEFNDNNSGLYTDSRQNRKIRQTPPTTPFIQQNPLHNNFYFNRPIREGEEIEEIGGSTNNQLFNIENMIMRTFGLNLNDRKSFTLFKCFEIYAFGFLLRELQDFLLE